MFSTLKQRTIAVYHFLKWRKPHLGAFVFLSILFLAGYFLVGVYASSTGHLSIFSPSAALAEDKAPEVGTLMTWAIEIILWTARMFLSVAMFAMHFIIAIAGYNGYLHSTAVNVGWVMVRDITNMFFVVILLLVAFGTILGLEQYEWKKMLVKFFLAAVLVNFSRVICGVIIDVGQVVMITFVNGIAATSDGNLIKAFNMGNIMGISNTTDGGSFKTEHIFTTSLAALVFSSILMAMMLVFVFILVSRMIVLWVLIVLSPFAFVLSVIPQTQKFASQWWSEFGNHVVVGPAIVFFLWLSFAVVGGGQIYEEISSPENTAVPSQIDSKDTSGIGEIMKWTSMANFAIAIGILMVGAKTSQSLGTVGGSAMGKATDFGKKVAMVASGASAAMWAGKKAKEGAAATGKWAAMKAPVIGGDAWVRKGKAIAGVAKIGWSKVSQKRDELAKKMTDSSKKITKAKETVQREIDSGKIKESERGARLAEEYKKANVSDDGIMAAGRFVKMLGAAVLESSGRADKRVKNIEEAAEKEKVIEEGEYSLSSTWGGRLKRSTRARAEFSEEKQKAKGERYSMEDKGAMLERDKYKMKNANDDLKKNEAEIKLIVETKGEDRSTWSEDEVSKVTTAEENIKTAQAALKEVEDHSVAMGAIAAKAQLAPKKETYEQIERESENAFAETKKGAGYMHDLNMAAQGKKAAEEFIKKLKENDLKKQFEEAGELLEKAIEGGGGLLLENLVRNNAYVRAMQMTSKAHHGTETLEVVQKTAESIAKTEFVDKGSRGFGTTSNVLVSVAKRSAEDLSSLNNEALASAMISNLALVAAKGEKGTSDISQRVDLFGTVSKVTAECYIDDTIAQMAHLLNTAKADPSKLTESQKKQATDLEAVFGESGLKMLTKAEDGTYDGISNERSSSILENYAITGGNVALMKQHAQVEEAMSRPENEDKSYKDVAQQTLGENAGEFFKQSKKFDVFFKEATSAFKASALNGKHFQLGGHQRFDKDLDFHRMSTASEAKGTMQGEVRKRGSKMDIQYQGLGDVVGAGKNAGLLVRVVGDAFADTIGKATSHTEIKQVQDRTLDGCMGYKPSQAAQSQNGYGIIGAGFENQADFIKNVLLPQIAKGPAAVALMMQRKFSNVDKLEAEKRGTCKVIINGEKVENMSGVIEQVIKSLGGEDKLGDYKDEVIAALAKAKAVESKPYKAPTPAEADAEADAEEDK